MQETIMKCDACGNVITGPTDHPKSINFPAARRRSWIGLYRTTWVDIDLCKACWCSLQLLASALTTAAAAMKKSRV